MLQFLNGFESMFRFFVLAEEFFGAFDGIFSLAQQVMDQVEVFDIDGSEIPIAFSIFPGLEDAEFRFPEAEEGLVDVEHLGNLAHGVILFAEEDVVCGDVDEVSFGCDFFQGFTSSFGFDLFYGFCAGAPFGEGGFHGGRFGG